MRKLWPLGAACLWMVLGWRHAVSTHAAVAPARDVTGDSRSIEGERTDAAGRTVQGTVVRESLRRVVASSMGEPVTPMWPAVLDAVWLAHASLTAPAVAVSGVAAESPMSERMRAAAHIPGEGSTFGDPMATRQSGSPRAENDALLALAEVLLPVAALEPGVERGER